MRKKVFLLMLVPALLLGGCRQADRVSYNVSKEADNFNVIRRLSVISALDNKPIFELIGAFSFEVSEKRITVMVETGVNEYKKHSIGLGELNFWVVEDLHGASVDKYRYEVNFLPEMIVPVTITSND